MTETTTTQDGAPARRFGPWRREVRTFLELFAVCGIAVAQPTLDLLAKNSAFFVIWRTDRMRFLALTFLIVVGPPIALWAVEVVAGLIAPKARRFVHVGLIGVVVAIIGFEIVKKITELGSLGVTIVGVAIGIAGAVLVFRFSIVQTWLRFLAIAPVIFAMLFVFASPATPLVFNDSPPVADVTVERPARIVMIVMDELPTTSLLDGDGRIDAELYPNFAALAAQSTWYRNNTTVAQFSDVAVPAIVTGRMPEDPKAIPVAASYPESLFTILGNSYDLNVHESITSLCPKSLCGAAPPPPGVHSGLRQMVTDTADLWREFAQPQRVPGRELRMLNGLARNPLNPGRKFVRTLQPSDGPKLDYIHLALPHFPWFFLGTGQNYTTVGEHDFDFPTLSWDSQWDAFNSHQRHLLQVQATDWLLGQVMNRLRDLGEYDDTMIVLTADHGAAFDPKNPFRGASHWNYPDIIWTPLLVKAPGQVAGKVDDRCARTIDIVPTMLDHLGVRDPWELDGRSLLGAPRRCKDLRIFDWDFSAVHPDDGSNFFTISAETGFELVLKARAAPPGDPDLRLYSRGKFGSLVGQPAAPLLEPNPPRVTATVDEIERYDSFDPTTREVSWPMISGWVGIPTLNVPLAVVVNGRIAGIAETTGIVKDGRTGFYTMLPLKLLNPAGNDISLARIVGDPGNPRLQTIRVER